MRNLLAATERKKRAIERQSREEDEQRETVRKEQEELDARVARRLESEEKLHSLQSAHAELGQRLAKLLESIAQEKAAGPEVEEAARGNAAWTRELQSPESSTGAMGRCVLNTAGWGRRPAY